MQSGLVVRSPLRLALYEPLMADTNVATVLQYNILYLELILIQGVSHVEGHICA